MKMMMKSDLAHSVNWPRQPACPTASDLRDWFALPTLVDDVSSPDPAKVLESARRLEELSRRHADWLSSYQATLVCVTGLNQGRPAARHLLATVMRLVLSPSRRLEVERLAAGQ